MNPNFYNIQRDPDVKQRGMKLYVTEKVSTV